MAEFSHYPENSGHEGGPEAPPEPSAVENGWSPPVSPFEPNWPSPTVPPRGWPVPGAGTVGTPSPTMGAPGYGAAPTYPVGPPGAGYPPHGTYPHPSGAYPPLFPSPLAPPPSGARRGAFIALLIIGPVLLVALLVGLALPTFRSLEARRDNAAAAWFQGGVPNNWAPTTVNDIPSTQALEAAWQTPGPVVDGFYPCVYIVQLLTTGGTSPTTVAWLESLAVTAMADGWRPSYIYLADGAPALAVYVPSTTGQDRSDKNVPLSNYLVYARQGSGFYRVSFMTEVSGYTAELPAVSPVMDRFAGTQSTSQVQ